MSTFLSAFDMNKGRNFVEQRNSNFTDKSGSNKDLVSNRSLFGKGQGAIFKNVVSTSKMALTMKNRGFNNNAQNKDKNIQSFNTEVSHNRKPTQLAQYNQQKRQQMQKTHVQMSFQDSKLSEDAI